MSRFALRQQVIRATDARVASVRLLPLVVNLAWEMGRLGRQQAAAHFF
jgi:hypothetical protein